MAGTRAILWTPRGSPSEVEQVFANGGVHIGSTLDPRMGEIRNRHLGETDRARLLFVVWTPRIGVIRTVNRVAHEPQATSYLPFEAEAEYAHWAYENRARLEEEGKRETERIETRHHQA